MNPIPGVRAATREAPGDEREPTGSFSYFGAAGLVGVPPGHDFVSLTPSRGVEIQIRNRSNPGKESSHAQRAWRREETDWFPLVFLPYPVGRRLHRGPMGPCKASL